MIEVNAGSNLTAAQARKSTLFERKMTLRRSNSGFHKPVEITLIDHSILYNSLLRGVSNKTKNSFIIYDFTSKENELSFKGDNVIKIQDYPDIVEMLQKSPDSIKIQELQKLLPKQKEDLFSKRMRFYNFIILNTCKSSEFTKIFDNQVQQFFQDNPEVKMDLLLNGGYQKVNEKFFVQSINNSLFENPQLQETPDAKAWKLAANFHSVMKQNKIKELLFFKADTSTFFKKYPFMSHYLESLNNTSTLVYPNEVFYGRFFYGNWKHAQSEEVFTNTKITHVLNATQEVENYFEKSQKLDVKYCKISIEDLDGVNIYTHFEKGFKFLKEALENPSNKVFVHCAQGKSRSATFVCVFFMRMYEWTFDQTIKYVSDRREIACPNPGFTEQLKEFEKKGFLFEGEDATLKKDQGESFLHILSELSIQEHVIHEQDEESCSDCSNEEEYFEEGSKEDQLYKEIQIRFSTHSIQESTPIQQLQEKKSFSNFQLQKQDQLKINQEEIVNQTEIEIK
ncbi:dual specificity phosphatase domain protein (macronuclear) [Tetrahymena thermophila SB210]|uniref:protein-tyrosine-phosphatase n=1 Tax=Tetrahymena thermophila (strain SB210) TaxID=312017 RepID=I7M3T9_TETTS|nr:dual specificity phosphatase domain protein [Tetrahymena thermophila SB210]EAS04287.1 dual specificity phosphatase domain protein [Tetrahymena thermophila SB210]|eukprot:XP_001024532.1 dual specificity phosphatase domain protein [Tetrahymena thermophila SB210]